MRKRLFTLVCFVFVLPSICFGGAFTLSDSALLSLDYSISYLSPCVVSSTDVAGVGVEFEIFYPGLGSSFHLLSKTNNGSGALTGIDISEYDAFALDFTLLSINGQTDNSNYGGLLFAGAYINKNGTQGYVPERLGFASNYSTYVTSTTPTDEDVTSVVGFCLNIPYWWYDEIDEPVSPWNPDGNTVRVLISATEGAAVVPEPATLLLFGVGGLVLRRRRFSVTSEAVTNDQ